MKTLSEEIYVLVFGTGHIYTQRDLPVLFGKNEVENVPQWIKDVNGTFRKIQMSWD